MFCSECGTKVNEGAKFCFQCGARLTSGEQEINRVEASAKEVPKGYVLYVERKVVDTYLKDEEIALENLYKKAKFYEVDESKVDKIIENCRGKIGKLEKFIESIYEESIFFSLDEEQEEEIANFGNLLGFNDDDVEELLERYDEIYHVEEKQEIYNDCIMKYVDDGKILAPKENEKSYKLEVMKLFEKNMLRFEEIITEQYKLAKNYELSKEQVELIYSEGEKFFPEESIVGLVYSYDKKNGIIAIKEEEEKKKTYESMTKFELYGKVIALTEEECNGIKTGKSWRKTYKIIRENFLRFYNKADCTKDGYWDEINKKVITLINSTYEAMVKTLENRGVSLEDISRIEYREIYKYWIPVFEDIDYKYNVICIGTEGAEYYRKLRKENRGRLVGGGFGLEGAFKGIATAGAINLATGAAHSAFNFVGNIRSEWKKLQAIKELFGASLKKQVLQVLENTVQLMYVTELAVMDAYNVPSKRYQLFYTGHSGSAKVFNVEQFQNNPFDEMLYDNAINTQWNDDGGMKKFAEFTGIDVSEAIRERNKRELEARSADGIVFATVTDKELYCQEKEVYTKLFDEIKSINVWTDKEEFKQKFEKLKNGEKPYTKQLNKQFDDIIKWCSEALQESNRANRSYLSEILKVAKGDTQDETIVCEGHNNYDDLLNYFNNIIHFENDERVVLFITSYKKEPKHALIFGINHIYHYKSERYFQYDYQAIKDIRYELEKGSILNDKVTRLEIVFENNNIVDVTSLFSSRGSSNYQIKDIFVLAMKNCIEISKMSQSDNPELKTSFERVETNTERVQEDSYSLDLIEKMKQIQAKNTLSESLDEMLKIILEIRKPIDDAISRNDLLFVWEEINKKNTYAEHALEDYYKFRCEKCINEYDVAEMNKVISDVIDRAKQGDVFALYLQKYLERSMYARDCRNTYKEEVAAQAILDIANAGNTSAIAMKGFWGIKGYHNATKTKSEGLKYLEKAAKDYSPTALAWIGDCYKNGNCGLSSDRETAKYYFSLAAEYGQPYAKSELKKMNGSSGGDSSCFITTAVFKSFGKPDDCYELTSFRKYRDNWLAKQVDGEQLIREYYVVAPAVVDAIDAQEDALLIYKAIWEKYLKKCLEYIESEQFGNCKDLYMKMVNTLKEKYLK